MSQTVGEAHPVAAWILASRNEDGGFGAFPGDISALRPSYWALQALRELGVSVTEAEQTASFIRSRQNEDGGFRGRPWGLRWTEKSTLIESWHAVTALRSLGEPVPRAESLVEFVGSRQRADGAFLQDLYPEKAGVVAESHYAVTILRELGVDVPESAKLVHFLQDMQRRNTRGDGGFVAEDCPDWARVTRAAREWAGSVTPYRDPGPEDVRAIPVSVGYTHATHRAASALRALGAPPADVRGAIEFLCAQQHETGGFLGGMGVYGAYRDMSEGRMADTWHAISALHLLVSYVLGDDWSEFLESGRFDRGRCARWVASCQNADGGLAPRPDPASRPSDMASTAQGVQVLSLLGERVPAPSGSKAPERECVPPGAEFRLSSLFFQPDQDGQALFLHRVVAPIRAAEKSDEATALEVMRWLHCQIVFHENYRNEAALLLEDGLATCGGQARLLAGALEAAAIPARFLMIDGHGTTEALIDGRWCLLDAEFNGAFRRPDGRLYSAIEVHERDRRGKPQVTTFGDWRYRDYTIVWPRGGAEYDEIRISSDDNLESPSARRAYPELAR